MKGRKESIFDLSQACPSDLFQRGFPPSFRCDGLHFYACAEADLSLKLDAFEKRGMEDAR